MLETDFNALKLLECLSKESQKSKFTKDFFESIKDETTELCKFLDCSIEQAAILSVILNLNLSSKDAQIGSISEYIGCSPFYLLSKTKDLEILIEKEYIVKAFKKQMILNSSSEFDIHYLVHDELMHSLIGNKFIHQKSNTGLNSIDFLYEINQEVLGRFHNEASYNFLLRSINKLKDNNTDCSAVKAANKYMLTIDEEIVAYMVCHATIDYKEITLSDLLAYVFDSERRKSSFKNRILNEQSVFFQKGLLKYTPNQTNTDINLAMTTRGLKAFLGEESKIFIKIEVK
jgi:hypothetical protein